MKFDPDLHHRRSIRLRGYDYAQSGAYFVTICTQGRESLFGDIRDNESALNAAGWMIQRWWAGIATKFAFARVGESVVMPNHFHGVVMISASDAPDGDPVGAVLSGRPLSAVDGTKTATAYQPSQGAHAGAPLPVIVAWFKTMTTNEYIRGVRDRGWPRLNGRLWQRNYYERVIRSEQELQQVRQYIIDNPRRWNDDPNHPSKLPIVGVVSS